VSCSYGPGRYDEQYEQRGIDYPLPYVRWTEKRNFEAVLQSISSGKLEVKSLITGRVSIDNYKEIYNNISDSGTSIASILEYPVHSNPSGVIILSSSNFDSGGSGIGVIGAGNFTQMTMLPALKRTKAFLIAIASKNGLTGTTLAKKYNISKSTTDYKEILSDQAVDLVMITTRHNQHASLVLECINANKHIFVEKPLALNITELDNIIASYTGGKTLTTGFNRRFSPHIQKIKSLIGSAPMNVIATVNAGFMPPNVWVHDLKAGGGRIIGEACHFIDLITFLTGSKVKAVCMNAMGPNPQANTDNATILLEYENGSTGVINYFSNGSKAYSKERIEVYSQQRTAIIDNFRLTEGFGFKGFSKMKTKIDKGHTTQFSMLVERLKNGGDSLIPFDEIVNTTRASFAAIESMKTREWININ
jgi:predicted dehydrogenase